MNKETEQVVAQILQQALTVAQKTGEFVVEQAPDVIQQLIMWKMATSIFAIVASLVALYVAYRLHRTVITKTQKYDYDYFDYPEYLVPGIFITVIGLVVFIVNTTELLKLYFAPKIYLIEYVSKLISK